jgi:hypothetical protein
MRRVDSNHHATDHEDPAATAALAWEEQPVYRRAGCSFPDVSEQPHDSRRRKIAADPLPRP